MHSLQHGLLGIVGFFLFIFAPIRGDDVVPGQQGRPLDIDQRLKSIVVSIDFTNAKLDEALQALTIAGKQHDPDPKGINFVVSPVAAESAKPITLKLDKVPMDVALHYICELGRVKYKIHDTSIEVSSFWGCGMDVRTFHVDPSFVGISRSASTTPAPKAP